MSELQDTTPGSTGFQPASTRVGNPCYPNAKCARKLMVMLPAALVLAGAAAFYNGQWGVFLCDDLPVIRDNPHIRTIWPISEAMSLPLWNTGLTVDARPILSLSLAVNHRLFGPEPWGYHLVNIAIHLLAGLTLMGVMRRTLLSPRLAGRFTPAAAAWFAFVAALLWVVHPLHTGSVTYLVQRAESLMGLFYLLTLYCAIRGLTSARGWPWFIASAAACWLGAATKEVIASAPLMVLLWDWVFGIGALRASLCRRWGFYSALAASWFISAGLVIATWSNKSIDFDQISPATYALTQPGVILHYLRLAFWPDPLVLSYGWPAASTWTEIVVPAIPLACLLGLTVWGLWRRHWCGMLGAWFFLILAPSSSFIPTQQMAFEHRMYLPLAAVAVLAVASLSFLLNRLRPAPLRRLLAIALVIGAAAALGAKTHLRNGDYRNELSFWADNVQKRPNDWAGHFVLGNRLKDRGDVDSAIREYRISLQLDPRHAGVRTNLATVLLDQGEVAEAAAQAERAVRRNPRYAPAHAVLGLARFRQRRWGEAAIHLRDALKLSPGDLDVRCNLAAALNQSGKAAEALEHCRVVLASEPDSAQANSSAGLALLSLGRFREACGHLESAIRGDPASSNAKNLLAMVRASASDDSVRDGCRAVALAEDVCRMSRFSNPMHLDVLAASYAENGQFQNAIATVNHAIGLLGNVPQSDETVVTLRQHLTSYQAGQPLRIGP